MNQAFLVDPNLMPIADLHPTATETTAWCVDTDLSILSCPARLTHGMMMSTHHIDRVGVSLLFAEWSRELYRRHPPKLPIR